MGLADGLEIEPVPVGEIVDRDVKRANVSWMAKMRPVDGLLGSPAQQPTEKAA